MSVVKDLSIIYLLLIKVTSSFFSCKLYLQEKKIKKQEKSSINPVTAKIKNETLKYNINGV